MLLSLGLGCATWAFTLDLGSWRRDVMQAADNAGLYLFIFSPVLAAVCAWSAERARANLGELAALSPSRALVWRSVWLPAATVAAGLHLVVLLAMVITAWSSAAVGQVAFLPVMVQFLSIYFFAALGAWAAAVVRSPLTAPAVFVVLLLANTLFADLGFRKISEVGTGAGDFIDLRLGLGYLLPKAALFGAFVLYALPLRAVHVTWILRTVLHRVMPLAAAGLAIVVMTGNTMPEEWAPTTQACHVAGAMSVCEPQELVGHTRDLDEYVDAVDDLLHQIGGVTIPARVDYVSRGAAVLSRSAVDITVTSQALPSSTASARAVEFGFAYALGCSSSDDVAGPPQSVLEAHAVLDGWLQHQFGTVQPGSFPADRVSRLLAQSPARQRAVVRSLMNQVWSCAPKISGLP